MSLKVPNSGFVQLLKAGYKHQQGFDDAVLRNIESVQEISRITKSSFGPNGSYKIILNHLEKVFVTNDAATIMKELDVIQPAARLVVSASQHQEAEMGNCTNLVIILAGELLKRAHTLFKTGLHSAEIIDGYRYTASKVLEILPTLVVDKIDNFHDEQEIQKAIVSTIASKQYGQEDFISKLVAKAVVSVMPKNPKMFITDSIRVARIFGSSLINSTVIPGMLFVREPEGAIKSCKDAKVAVYGCPIDVSITETKGTVLITKVSEILNFSKEEEEKLDGIVKKLVEIGVNVVVTGGAIGDLVLHFMNRHNIMVHRVPSKFDLRRLARLLDATALPKFSIPTKEELGSCKEVSVIEIGSERCTVFNKGSEKSKTSTICLRGGTQGFLEDVERSIDDAVMSIKNIVKDPRLLPGAGATEISLAVKLNAMAEVTPELDQYAMNAFAESFKAIPHAIAFNSGIDATLVVSKLIKMHSEGNNLAGVDVDSVEGEVLKSIKEKNIYDSFITKEYAIKLAAEVATTVISIDQIIMSKQAGGPTPRKNPNWDED